jgi:hypothetical protein
MKDVTVLVDGIELKVSAVEIVDGDYKYLDITVVADDGREETFASGSIDQNADVREYLDVVDFTKTNTTMFDVYEVQAITEALV